MEKVTREFRCTPKDAGNLMEKIHTMDDVYELSGLERGKPIIEINVPPQLKQAAEGLADTMDLTILANLLNGKDEKGNQWVPDWENGKQKKWVIYVNTTPGSGFSLYVVAYDLVYASLGARPVFRTEESARFAWNKFQDLCKRVAAYNSHQYK